MNVLDFASWYDADNLDVQFDRLEDRARAQPRLAPDDSYALDWQARRHERLVLMEHRRGLRLEWNVTRRELEIWISPASTASILPGRRLMRVPWLSSA